MPYKSHEIERVDLICVTPRHVMCGLIRATLLAALQGKAQAETTGKDNLKTLELVYAAYDSARTAKAIKL